MDQRIRTLERREQEAGGTDAPLATATALARAGRTYAEIILGYPERVTALAHGYRNKTSDAVAIVVNSQLDRWTHLSLEQIRTMQEGLSHEHRHSRRAPAIQKEKDIEKIIHLNARLARYPQAEAYLAQIHPKRAGLPRFLLARETAENNDFLRADNYALTLAHTTESLSNLKVALAGCAARHGNEKLALRYANEAGKKYKNKAFQSIALGFALARDYAQASTYLQDSTFHSDKATYGELAVIAEQNKDTEDADNISLRPLRSEHRCQLANIAAKNRDYARAERFAPNFSSIAQTAAENGDYDRATRYYETNTRFTTDVMRRELNTMLARAAAKRGDTATFEQLRPYTTTADYTSEWPVGYLRQGNAVGTEECMTSITQHPVNSSIADHYHLKRWIEIMEIVGGL